MIEILDLNFQNTPSTIASFLIKGPQGYVLVESGPASTHKTLKAQLEKRGIAFSSIAAVLVTHIHLDHSGGAWALAKEGIPIYVHPIGIPHLVNPEKLVQSATRIYGEKMDTLWGKINPIEASLVHRIEDEEQLNIAGLKISCFHTPGHASHHITYMINGALIAGDLCGVKIAEGPISIPAPPPEAHIELWIDSIERMRNLKADEIYLVHFGKIAKANIEQHYNDTEVALNDLKNWIAKVRKNETNTDKIIKLYEENVAQTIQQAGGDNALVNKYFVANPPFMSVGGMLRYFKKHIDIN